MMTSFQRKHAALLAATEVLPGEWRDLADLIDAHGLAWLEPRSDSPPTDSRLADHVRFNLDPGRLDHWMAVLTRLAADRPYVRMVCVGDQDYPRNLGGVYNRPPFLFVEGSLRPNDQCAAAIVGSRRASAEGIHVAEKLASELAAADVTVVSGLAAGIDAAAHQGALAAAAGRTLAVFGTGIDRVVPEANTDLADRIRRRGALLSQFRPGSPPTRSTFPMRNAVISGLSRASVVIEASERSGTRSEAEHALRQHRPVLLWAPILRRHRWARDFADSDELVSFVDSVEEILAAVQEPTLGSHIPMTA